MYRRLSFTISLTTLCRERKRDHRHLTLIPFPFWISFVVQTWSLTPPPIFSPCASLYSNLYAHKAVCQITKLCTKKIACHNACHQTLSPDYTPEQLSRPSYFPTSWSLTNYPVHTTPTILYNGCVNTGKDTMLACGLGLVAWVLTTVSDRSRWAGSAAAFVGWR